MSRLKKPENLKKVQVYGERTDATNDQLLQAYNSIFIKYAIGGVTMTPPTVIEKNLKNHESL